MITVTQVETDAEMMQAMADVLERHCFGEEITDGIAESYNNEDVITVLQQYREHIGGDDEANRKFLATQGFPGFAPE